MSLAKNVTPRNFYIRHPNFRSVSPAQKSGVTFEESADPPLSLLAASVVHSLRSQWGSARHRDGSSADACGHRRCPLPLVPACAVKRGCSSSGCAYWCPTSTTPSHAIRAGRNRCVAAGLSTRVTLTFHQHELTTLVLMPCGHLTQSSPLPRCPLNHGPALRNDQC